MRINLVLLGEPEMSAQYMTPHGVPLPFMPIRRGSRANKSIGDPFIKNLLVTVLYIVFLVALFVFL